ncbi:hypothetical protein F5B20DRAFT_554997 [Whalleya microplaca]|nr:hypothetical protein F5B20DRAFT_554997 [Whalleya microplaca]
MAILPTDETKPRGNRPVVVAVGITITLAMAFLTALLVLPRLETAVWMENGRSWVLSGFKESYTPTENLLIASSVFSLFVSVMVELLLFSVRRHRSKQTKRWLRYVLFVILFANAILAFVAFLCASFNDSGETPEKSYMYMPDEVDQSIDDEARFMPRWLGLLISLFSLILLVTAWMDFKEEDQWEQEYSTLVDRVVDEKNPHLFCLNDTQMVSLQVV